MHLSARSTKGFGEKEGLATADPAGEAVRQEWLVEEITGIVVEWLEQSYEQGTRIHWKTASFSSPATWSR